MKDNKIELFFELLEENEKLIPEKATSGSSGYDLKSRIDAELNAGSFQVVPTGIKIQLPPGLEAQIRPRSGLAAKFGVTVLNSPGTIDSDYRGEIGIILINHSKEVFKVEKGMRIAQMVICQTLGVNFSRKETLDATSRGSGGFGSTGK
ncbi:MAG: dUTP diphosphatase [Candidatus Riflebacteria bacterium]|nr:dUTP diphosphatase [Candidatus Riflebacteria bacterium]